MPRPISRYSAILFAAGLSVWSGCQAQAVPARGEPRPRASAPAGSVLLQGAGATFPSVLYNAWFERYRAEHPGVVIDYDAVGSGEGIRRFIGRDVSDDELVDFGASDAAMRDDEIARVPSGALLVPMTAGSVTLAYNLPDVTDLRLSREAYAGIFLGRITQWNDPRIARTNPGAKLPRLTIATVVRQDGSGTTFAFTKHLDTISEAWRAEFGAATLVNWPGNAMRATGNEGVAGRIKQSVGSIGYVGYEFARRLGLSVAQLENKARVFVSPTASSASAAFASAELPANLRLYVSDPEDRDAYPVVTLTWILLRRQYDARKTDAIRDLLRWCLTAGQQDAAALGYAPLPPNVATRSLAALDDIHAAQGR
jgi:phosphate transport system substrate-binding protein